MSETSELDKMSKVKNQSQKVGEFVDWLQCEKKIVFCKWHEEKGSLFDSDDNCEPFYPGGYYPEFLQVEKTLAEFFGIDLDKIEKEKLKILEQLRKG